ncbi:MAG TPA: hypothetical protein VM781_02220 [Candidatus Bathyarchaeia archaeon]|nr:hypothetical protein [Candidatus Bathyarchaeia archaeon]
MSVRSSAVRLFIHSAMVVGAILTVTILLAAMPGHKAPSVEGVSAPQEHSAAASPFVPGIPRGSMRMEAIDERANETAAVSDMSTMHGSSAHMRMTEMRPQTAADVERAKQVAAQLRAGIEKYRDYHAALNEGYKIFLLNLPQQEYHFTKYKNGFLEALRFDPSEPTSLLYRKTADGYELVGAMYTMPNNATEEQLNERVPLSVAMWHQHTNLCMPQMGEMQTADWSKFGLKGSIATQEACDEAGGRFHPTIFGWMMHVYPYEDSLDRVFAMHHQD